MKGRPIKEQRLDDLESDFRPLLISCLEECENGRWGLFGQNDSAEAAKYLQWEDGQHLKEIALQIRALRTEFGRPNPLAVHTPRKVYQVPLFPRLRENAPRKGFVEGKEYRQLCEKCTEPWLRAMLALAYTFGFRKSELLRMRLNHVDLLNRSLSLEPGTTKNDEGRIVKLTAETFELVKQCMFSKTSADYLFTWKGGQPVRDFRGSWSRLTKAANLPGLLFHDLRRSAVRNMVRRGVPDVVAMRISGHKTRSVFDRYNIVNESDLADAAARIEQGAIRDSGHSSSIENTAQEAERSAHENVLPRKQ